MGEHDHGHDGHDHEVSDCQRILRELDIFLDGELSDDARASIDKHLRACTDCYQAFDFHAELKTVIAAKCHNDELPPGLIGRLEACLDTDLTTDDA